MTKQLTYKLRDEQQIISLLRDGNPLSVAGTLEGTPFRVSLSRSRLSPKNRELYETQDIVYTVLSYHTPIGWKLASGEWVIPDAKYSVTTSKHQNLLKYWLRNTEWAAS